jgi:hypothetical protein
MWSGDEDDNTTSNEDEDDEEKHADDDDDMDDVVSIVSGTVVDIIDPATHSRIGSAIMKDNETPIPSGLPKKDHVNLGTGNYKLVEPIGKVDKDWKNHTMDFQVYEVFDKHGKVIATAGRKIHNIWKGKVKKQVCIWHKYVSKKVEKYDSP